MQANWMQKQGVKQGDAVAIYLPMVRCSFHAASHACAQADTRSLREQVCELPIAMLACARIGAVHTVVFAGFSAESLAQRMADSKCGPAACAFHFWRAAVTLQVVLAVFLRYHGPDEQARAGQSCC